jgi:uncharacterized integral membrane protein
MPIVWLLLGAALVVVVSVFHAQNPRTVDLFLFGEPYYSLPLWLLVAIPTVVGVLVGLLAGLPGRVRAAWHKRKLGQLLRGHQQTIAEREQTIREREQTIRALEQRIADLERDLEFLQTPPPALPSGTAAVIDETVTSRRDSPEATSRTDFDRVA